VDLDLTLTPYYNASPIVLIHEFRNTAACITLSSVGRFILWSIKSKKQLETLAIIGGITCASVNKQGNVLATGHTNGVVRFYSIAKQGEIFLFKEFRMVKNGQVDKMAFSSNGEELAVLSKTENRVYYLLTSLSMEF
jgi:WD40 repeat protein